MNIDEFIPPVFGYYAEYAHNDGLGDFVSAYDDDEPMTREEFIAFCCDEYGVVGKDFCDGIWVGTQFGDADIDVEEDEDGKSLHVNIFGQVCIVSNVELPKDHPVYEYAYDLMQAEGQELIDEEMEGQAEAALYARDPYAYYGVRRSDFF